MSFRLVPLLFLCLIGGNVPAAFAQKPAAAAQFVIDGDRPIVYLHFVRYGPGMQFNDDEPKERIWFKFVNNCTVPVTIRTFGVPDGDPEDEAGVMDRVVRDEPMLLITFDYPVIPTEEPGVPTAPATPQSAQKLDKMPPGYLSEVGSLDTIQPGGSVLFSVPRNHLGNDWHMEIPFSFEKPTDRCCRDANVWGGEPEMFLRYSLYDLPDEVRAALKK